MYKRQREHQEAKDAGRYFTVQEGDIVEVYDARYKVVLDRRGYPSLEVVES